jgi:hypothetical protein
MRRTKSGVIPTAYRLAQHTDQVVEDFENVLVSEGAAGPKETLLFAAGASLFVRGTTNPLHLRQVKARAQIRRTRPPSVFSGCGHSPCRYTTPGGTQLT